MVMLEALLAKQNPTNALLTLQKIIVQWKMNIQTRSVLLELDDWQLDDIGIDRKEAREEGIKKFWQ